MITIKLDELIDALASSEKQALEQAANYCVGRAGSEILVEDYLLALLIDWTLRTKSFKNAI